MARRRLRLAEFYFYIKYRKGAHIYHADTLSHLLTWSPTVEQYDDDIPAFHFAEENDLDVSSSAITSDRSTIDNQEHLQYFLEPSYEAYDHVLTFKRLSNTSRSSPK